VNAMTGEILAFARGDTNLLLSRVYLQDFFKELAEHLRHELGGRSVVLSLDLEDRGVAWFDPHKIRRAIHNLVRNAVQAIGAGGGTVTIGVHRDPAGALVLTCSDDGPGVPEAIRERAFESFISHGKPNGTGLGLAIVQKVVQDHGGRIELQSRPGQTTFTITLPQVRTHSSQAPKPIEGEDGQAIA
jgi:signal transduction histidine kinase